MSATTRVAPPTAAATGLGLRDRVRSRTRANASPGRAENASARFAVGGEPSATALRASRDDHPGRFGDDSYGYERPLEGGRVASAGWLHEAQQPRPAWFPIPGLSSG